MSNWQVEYQGYYGAKDFDCFYDAIDEAILCIEAEFDAHNTGSDFEWNENVEGAVRIIKDGEIIMESKLEQRDDGLYDLVMTNVNGETVNE